VARAFLNFGANKLAGTGMKRLILILFILIAAALLAESRSSVPLGGADGMSLLKSMANVTSNLTENLTGNNNTTINLSRASSSAELSGTDGEDLLSNLTNGSSNDTKDGLSTWGSRPRSPPPAPSAASMKNARLIQVIRDNHIA
jgi:hypothetical protein